MIVALDGVLIDVSVKTKNIRHTYIHKIGNNRLLVTSNRLFDEQSLKKLFLENRAKVDKLLHKQSRKILAPTGTVSLFGALIPVESGFSKKSLWAYDKGILRISGKDEMGIAKALEAFYGRQVVEMAISELEKLQHTLGLIVSFKNLTFKSRRLKSRLGSYSQKTRTIMLNSLLGRFSLEYLKIILIHELVHINISGHQENFYKLLYAYVPDYRSKKRELANLIRTYEV